MQRDAAPKPPSRRIVERTVRRVERYIERHRLFPAGEMVVVAVSGGADSLCLLHILDRLRPTLGIRLHAAHLDHGLRGAEGAADAAFVREQTARLGLETTVGHADVVAFQRTYRCSLEEAAREERYRFLAQVAREAGASSVAVAHQSDDQAETVLLHLIRGSGLAGLRGMALRTAWRSARTGVTLTVVRPLLALRRTDTEAFCAALGLEPRQDPTNVAAEYLRNRVRHEVLPLFERLNPKSSEALVRLARSVADDLAFIDAAVEGCWPEVVVADTASEIVFDRRRASALPPALLRHLLRHAATRLLNGPQSLEAAHLEAMVEATEKRVGTKVVLPQGLIFSVEGERWRLRFVSEPVAEPPLPQEPMLLNVSGVTEVAGWRIEARLVSGPVPPTAGPDEAYLDADAAGPSVWVRRRRPGDRFQPLGMEAPRRLQDFFVDLKVPQAERDRTPLIVASGGIAWVAGHRIAHWARCTDTTRQVLALRCARIAASTA